MTKILVTGATGTVGSEVAKALLDAGASVRLGVRNSDRVKGLVARGAEAVRLDYDHPETLKPALEGVEKVFLLSGFIQNPLPQLEAVLEVAKSAGVNFVLRMSAVGADPASESPLARTHGKGEELVKNSGVNWSIIQPMFFMDNLFNYTGGSLERENVFYGAAQDGKVSYVSSQDIGRVAARILTTPETHSSKTYVLTGPEALDAAAVAALASNAFGRTIKYVDIPPEEFKAAAMASGLPEWGADDMTSLELIKANGFAADISPAVQQILGESGETYAAFLKRRV